MDVPLHLRLACANSLDEVYADRRTAHKRAAAVPATAAPPSLPAPPAAPLLRAISSSAAQRTPGHVTAAAKPCPSAPHQGHHWFSSLLTDMVGDTKREAVLWYADPAVNVSVTRGGSSRATTWAASDATEPLPPPAAAQQAADPEALSSPFPMLFEGFVEPVAMMPYTSHSPTRGEDTCRPGRLASHPEESLPSFASLSRTAASPSIEDLAGPADAAAGLRPASAPAPPVPSTTETAAQVNVAHDVAVEAQVRRVREELAGTHEAVFANVAADLERRLRECVLKTVALDDARQQLLCAFQLPTRAAAIHTTSATARADVATSAPSASASASASASPPQQLQEQHRLNASGAPPVPPALLANRAGDSALSDEARKEMALHLYGLRRQVQQLRDELDAHESVHVRQVNALRAAAAQGQRGRRSSEPPLRVEIVKAYEDDPVPYRKGPWREADFAAASVRGDGVVRAVSGVNLSHCHGPGRVEDERDDAAESYSEDDFTEVTSAAPSSVRTDTSVESAEVPRSSVSSTEALFRQREAAALRARAQRTARAAATEAAAVAASAGHVTSSDSSTLTTTSTDDTDSTLTSATRSTTTSTSDTDSDSY